MAVKFFGQFLMEKGAVAKEKLLQAIELQEATNLKFGETALALGLLTEADVARVHAAQRTEDRRFGDLAAQLGILSTEQTQQVLTHQKNNHLFLGEALVQVGGISPADLERYLAEFKVDQAPYQVDRVTIPAGVPSAPIWEMTADLTYKLLARLALLPCRPGPCRVVDKIESNDTIAVMELYGSLDAQYLLSVSPGIRNVIARSMLNVGSVAHESQEILDDTVMEFVNVVCGNVVAKAAQMGQTLEITPPAVFHPGPEGIAVPAGYTGLLFPIHVADGETVELVLFIQA